MKKFNEFLAESIESEKQDPNNPRYMKDIYNGLSKALNIVIDWKTSFVTEYPDNYEKYQDQFNHVESCLSQLVKEIGQEKDN